MPGKDFPIAEGKLRIPIGIGFLEFQRCLDGQIKIKLYHAIGKEIIVGNAAIFIRSLAEHVFYCGVLPDYKALFRKIIQELQLCRYGYEDYIASLFNDILLLVDRQQHEQKKATGNVQEQIERAAAYFNENYNTKISIDDYAESLHISTNWFIHNFKQYAGMSPAQYILSLRMVNAQSLLERTTYNIKEISEIVGYENPLYFSRVFKKEIGKSPAQYRKEMIPTEAV